MERELFHLGQKHIPRVAFKKLVTTLYSIIDFIYFMLFILPLMILI